jgi:hypothetical protein
MARTLGIIGAIITGIIWFWMITSTYDIASDSIRVPELVVGTMYLVAGGAGGYALGHRLSASRHRGPDDRVDLTANRLRSHRRSSTAGGPGSGGTNFVASSEQWWWQPWL